MAPADGYKTPTIPCLIAEYRKFSILNRWPDMKLGALDGLSPREAAADPKYRVKLLAAIMVLQYYVDCAPLFVRSKRIALAIRPADSGTNRSATGQNQPIASGQIGSSKCRKTIGRRSCTSISTHRRLQPSHGRSKIRTRNHRSSQFRPTRRTDAWPI